MCGSPKSRQSQSVTRSSGSIFDANSDALERYTARANAVCDRREVLKVLKAQQIKTVENPEHESKVTPKTGWRYWLLKADLSAIILQSLFGEKTPRESA